MKHENGSPVDAGSRRCIEARQAASPHRGAASLSEKPRPLFGTRQGALPHLHPKTGATFRAATRGVIAVRRKLHRTVVKHSPAAEGLQSGDLLAGKPFEQRRRRRSPERAPQKSVRASSRCCHHAHQRPTDPVLLAFVTRGGSKSWNNTRMCIPFGSVSGTVRGQTFPPSRAATERARRTSPPRSRWSCRSP